MSTTEVGRTLLIEIVINWLCGDKGNCTFIISNWLRGLSKGQIMTLFMAEPWPECRQLEIVTLVCTQCGYGRAERKTVVYMLTQTPSEMLCCTNCRMYRGDIVWVAKLGHMIKHSSLILDAPDAMYFVVNTTVNWMKGAIPQVGDSLPDIAQMQGWFKVNMSVSSRNQEIRPSVLLFHVSVRHTQIVQLINMCSLVYLWGNNCNPQTVILCWEHMRIMFNNPYNVLHNFTIPESTF